MVILAGAGYGNLMGALLVGTGLSSAKEVDIGQGYGII